MSSLMIWFDVPDESTLALAVGAEEGVPFVAGVRILEDDGVMAHETIVEHAELSPGPKEVRIRGGRSYSARVRVEHLSRDPEDVVITAHIRMPDGQHLQDDYEYTLTGRRGDNPQRATLVVVGIGAI